MEIFEGINSTARYFIYKRTRFSYSILQYANRALFSRVNLFFILIAAIISALLTSLCTFSAITSRTATSQSRSESKIDVLLGIESNNKRRNIDNLPLSGIERKNETWGHKDGVWARIPVSQRGYAFGGSRHGHGGWILRVPI